MGRRTETTDYLKESIADALLSLMEDHEIDKIRIEDITNLAGVGRVTYFRYFDSKADAILYKLQLLFFRWAEKHPIDSRDTNIENALKFFTFCKSIEKYIRLLNEQNQLGPIFELAFPKSSEQNDSIHDKYLQMLSAYALLAIVRVWAANDFKESPEDLVSILKEL